jgi:DNA adenine methylase
MEPFAGGGIVSLSAVFDGLAKRAVMVELDSEIAAVWQTILNGDAEWLAEEIVKFDLTPESVSHVLSSNSESVRQRAFRTIVKNRTYHGGILAPGSGLIKHGENGKGLSSRWYPETLRKRILGIASIKDRIEFIEGDGIEVIRETAHKPDVAFFIDPPYTAAGKKAGKRLYTHFDLDHEELFRVVAATTGDFLMTYDDADGVREMARQHNFDTLLISMKNTHHAKMTELLIGRCLDWAR